jgi:DNA-directed RNA polymerase specialized sigma24 family protein
LTAGTREDRLSAFEELYAAPGERLKSIAFNLLRSRTDAENAVQEAFLRTLTNANGNVEIRKALP